MSIKWEDAKVYKPENFGHTRILIWGWNGPAIAEYTESIADRIERSDDEGQYIEESWCICGHEVEFTHWAAIQEP